VKKLLFVAAAVVAWWFLWREPEAKWRGMPAARDPVQSSASIPRAFKHDQYTITPLASYRVSAVVLGRERYRNDPASAIAPVDLALGWGPMSVAEVLNHLDISQSGRWYEYSWTGDPPLDQNQIALHSANTHCIPANAETRAKLLRVKRHDVVTLEGYLVEVTSDDGYRWRSSLSRDDTRGGSCEVMWITSVTSQKL
jgi:hypothetical protein